MTKEQKIRYLRLNQVFNKALTQSISKLQNWEKVSSCFPEYASTKEGATNLANCQRQVIEFWTELCRREFEEILVERNVEEKLDELDELIVEAKDRLRKFSSDDQGIYQNTAIEDLSSQELVECNLYGQRLEASKELDKRLEVLNGINGHMEQELKILEATLKTEQLELKNVYNVYLGSAIENPLDETLVQGLSDMVLELREC